MSQSLLENEVKLDSAALWQRFALASSYGTGATSSSSLLDFIVRNVVDLLEPTSLAIWKSEPDRDWQVWASSGVDKHIDGGDGYWTLLNRNSVLSRTTSKEIDETSFEIHICVPVIMNGHSCYVLHLWSLKNPVLDSIFDAFLQSLTHLIINLNLLNGKSRLYPYTVNHKDEDLELSPRQQQILALIRQELTYSQIASRIGYSESTIKQEAMRIFKKIGVHGRSDAIRNARL